LHRAYTTLAGDVIHRAIKGGERITARKDDRRNNFGRTPRARVSFHFHGNDVEKTLASNRTRNGPTDGLSALHARVLGAAINKKSGLLQRLLRAEWRARAGRKETDRENIAVVRDSGPANKRKTTLCIYHRRVNRARKNNRSTLLQLPAARIRARKNGKRRTSLPRDCERAISSYFNGRMCFFSSTHSSVS